MNSATCSVLRCSRAAVHAVPLAPDAPGTPNAPGTPVCGEHHSEMDTAPWVYDGTRDAVLLGADLPLIVDRSALHVEKSYGPGLGPFSTLTIDARAFGDGEPTTVSLVLTDDVVRQLSKLIWMFNRR